MNRLTTGLRVLLCLVTLALPASLFAQNPYSAAVKVNGSAVTWFEIDQREKMLRAFQTIGDLRSQAIEELIDDRLRQQAARAMGQTLTPEELNEGLAEFAQRANMTVEQFEQALANEGVFPETFRDFVRTGLLWRKVVSGRFQAKAFITEAELDTALALGTTALGASVLLSEIIMPFDETTREQTLEFLTGLRRGLRSLKDFEEAALTYSAAASRADSGRLDWTPLSNLPPAVGTMLLTMSTGEVTEPIELPGAYALFQLRGLRADRNVAAKTIALDYAILRMPGGRSESTLKTAAQLEGAIDTCLDLQAKAERFPEGAFTRSVLPVRQVPRDIARELEQLDPNEVSTNLTSGANGEFLTFLMLCGRTNELSEGNREEVRLTLFNQRMEAFGAGYLQELRGDAVIVRQ